MAGAAPASGFLEELELEPGCDAVFRGVSHLLAPSEFLDLSCSTGARNARHRTPRR